MLSTGGSILPILAKVIEILLTLNSTFIQSASASLSLFPYLDALKVFHELNQFKIRRF
jgi:hypothetical protein